MKPFNIISALVSTVTLIVLVFDFYVTREFHIEGIFIAITAVILGFNIIRHLKTSLWTKGLPGIFSNLLLAGFTVYGFVVLALTGFGYGFTGRGTPVIWVVLLLCNLLLSALTVADIIYLRKRTKLT